MHLKKYDKNKIIDVMKAETYTPTTLRGLYRIFRANDKKSRKYFRSLIKELEMEGKVVRDKDQRYHVVGKDLVAGTIEFARKKNVAFVVTDDGEEFIVFPEDAGFALHRDRVLVKVTGEYRGMKKAKVIKVLARGLKKIVGTLIIRHYSLLLIPDDPRLPEFFRVEDHAKGRPGEKVIGEITRYPSPRSEPHVRIIEVLGDPWDPRVDLPTVIIKHSLPQPGEFPQEVLEEVKKLPMHVRTIDLVDRVDLRDKPIVTIDGEDAKDFDDAVSLEKLEDGGYRLGVHIADVSHYVEEGSAIDREAFRRGTSVYLIDTVIPMLPFELSNNICSLVEGEDRLTITLDMIIDENGNTQTFEIYRSVIRNKKRLTYSLVNSLFAGDKKAEQKIGEFKKMLFEMRELLKILRSYRKRRGAILDVEGGEVKFVFDENGRVKDIIPVKRGDAEKLIEEFMIRANEIVASVFHTAGIPFIYRIHEPPDPETIYNLKQYLDTLGLSYGFPKNLHPGVLQKILEELDEHPLKPSVERLIVRSLKRAVYSPNNVGHFGLASSSYTHFTSPIRRYPDLIVHRILKEYIDGKLKDDKIEYWENVLTRIAIHSSRMERRADEAEWDLTDLKKVDYASQHIGEVFTAYVTGITRFGLFVEIPEKLVSGLVHVATMDDDYYIYDERKNILVGQKTGRIYRMGDELNVRVVNADKIQMEIDFEIVD
ncbi:MAG: ribonuclease R [Thermotogae bacterium]|nr:ribonuclease R [Thermotogota bacterium]